LRPVDVELGCLVDDALRFPPLLGLFAWWPVGDVSVRLVVRIQGICRPVEAASVKRCEALRWCFSHLDIAATIHFAFVLRVLSIGAGNQESPAGVAHLFIFALLSSIQRRAAVLIVVGVDVHVVRLPILEIRGFQPEADSLLLEIHLQDTSLNTVALVV
jgi:hypothetical protein